MIKHKEKFFVFIGIIILVVISFLVYNTYFKTSTLEQRQLSSIEQYMAVGIVEKISGQEIVLKDAKKIPENTTSVTKPKSLIVIVDQSTVLERFVEKDALVLKNEMENFTKKQKESQNTNIPVMPPEPFNRIRISLNDIKTGDTIVVFSAVNIRKLSSFTAKEINVQPTGMATLSR